MTAHATTAPAHDTQEQPAAPAIRPGEQYASTGYHDGPAPIISDRASAIIRYGCFSGHPDMLHQITTEALRELLDPTPSGPPDRAATAVHACICRPAHRLDDPICRHVPETVTGVPC